MVTREIALCSPENTSHNIENANESPLREAVAYSAAMAKVARLS